jgi:hypothetical protein
MLFWLWFWKNILCLVMKTVMARLVAFRDQIRLRLQPVLHLVAWP